MGVLKNVLIVGAGLSGAVLARELAEAGLSVQVIDARRHAGGNCHTERDPQTNVLVHVHGPHVFHTNNEEVWRYVQRFGEWVPFVHRVQADTGEGVFSFPINRSTINRFFRRTFSPREARAFIEGKAERGIAVPANFEEQALKCVGRELYETFFRGYTVKQWGRDPTELPPEIFNRLPVRFDDNGSYYECACQALPRHGYTRVIESLLDHPLVRISLATAWDPAMRREAGHLFFSGALDEFYGFSEGRLHYRTVFWHRETHQKTFQDSAVINHTRLNVPWTRVLEYKHFAPWESHAGTLVFREFSKETGENDIPHYPVRLETDRGALRRYRERAVGERGASFLGRLGTYRYLDMDQAIAETLEFSRSWLGAMSRGRRLPVFSRPPL